MPDDVGLPVGDVGILSIPSSNAIRSSVVADQVYCTSKRLRSNRLDFEYEISFVSSWTSLTAMSRLFTSGSGRGSVGYSIILHYRWRHGG